MNKLDEYWDWDGECHRGKCYPSGAVAIYLSIAAALVIICGWCWILQTLIQH